MHKSLCGKNTAILPLDHNKNHDSCLRPKGAISHSDSLDYKLLLQGKFILVFVNNAFVLIFGLASKL